MELQPYEFNASQNQLIRELSNKMRFVSYFLISFGVFLLVVGILSLKIGGLRNIIVGIIQIIIGIWTGKAASSFRLIVNTQGNDIENLIGALGQLNKLYVLQYWLLIVGLIFIALLTLLGLVYGIFYTR